MKMRKPFSLLSGVSLGAGLMYLFDPSDGKRRRSRMRDRITHMTHEFGDTLTVGLRDMRNRILGKVAAARSQLFGTTVPDEVLEARVRSKMGHYVTHPAGIQVMVQGGRVTLSGPILAEEVEPLLSALILVQGIKDIENRLEVARDSSDIPSLQGGHPELREGVGPKREMMVPATRLLYAAISIIMLGSGAVRRGITGVLLGITGIAIFAGTVARSSMRPSARTAGRRREIAIQKTLTVNAPIERVYDFWRDFENFPRFMSHLKEVRDLGEGRSYWKAVGPAGMLVDWGAVITKSEPNESLSWRSVPGSKIENEGRIHFDSLPEGGTRIHVEMSYAPPAGALGHWVASLLGSDPRSAMNDDLLRFKSLIEVGKTTAGGRELTLDELSRRGESTPEIEPTMQEGTGQNEATGDNDAPYT